MIRKLIVPAALLALSACAGSPTEPALRTSASRADAHPAFGSGVGLLPTTDDSWGTTAADANGGYLGSGNLEEQADAAPQLGSGAAADGGYLGSGNAVSGGYLGSGN